jgi:hypothetical protein
MFFSRVNGKCRLIIIGILLVLASTAAADKIFWGDGNWGSTNYIKSCDIDGSNITTLRTMDNGFYGALDVSIDPVNSVVYWVAPWGIIDKCNFDGTGYQRLTQISSGWIDFVSYDGVNSKLFIYNSNIYDEIATVSLTGSNYTIIVDEHVQCFDIDPVNNKLYYVTLWEYLPPYANQAGRVWSSNLDGSDASIIYEYNTNEWPEALVLHHAQQKVYWKTIRDNFMKINVDGSNAEHIFISHDFYCTGMEIDEKRGHFYWIDNNARKMQKADLDGSNVVDVLTNLGEDPYGIDLYIEGTPDECTAAEEVFVDVPYYGSTVGATGSDITSCAYNDYADMWLYFEPVQAGSYYISLCQSSFDTTLSVFADCASSEIVCDDDGCGFQSVLELKTNAGQRYYIRIAGYDGNVGDYTLTITPATNLKADINYDGVVDFKDFADLASEWLVEE